LEDFAPNATSKLPDELGARYAITKLPPVDIPVPIPLLPETVSDAVVPSELLIIYVPAAESKPLREYAVRLMVLFPAVIPTPACPQ
jgi:hypothetical protein